MSPKLECIHFMYPKRDIKEIPLGILFNFEEQTKSIYMVVMCLLLYE